MVHPIRSRSNFQVRSLRARSNQAIVNQSNRQQMAAHLPSRRRYSTLLLFFALAYVAQGFASQFGVIAQPVQFLMMKEWHMSAAAISTYLAILMLPWVLKPFFGLVCDFVPLFGYRRKSYLVLANLVAAAAFISLSLVKTLPLLICCLFAIACSTALSTALMVAMAVEAGRKDGSARDYFSGQVFFYYLANILAALLGGYLCQHINASGALSVAALIAVFPVLAVAALACLTIEEQKSPVALTATGMNTWVTIKEAARSRALWLGALLFFACNFIVCTGVPLYFFESHTLRFSQGLIGQVASCTALGLLCGSVVFFKCVKPLSLRIQLWISVAMVALSTIAYVALVDPLSAMVIEFFRGLASVICLLTLYGLAADLCPPRMEATVMALFLCARNLSTELATFTGGQLFTHAFHNQYVPLVFTAFGFTLITAFLVPHVVAAVDQNRRKAMTSTGEDQAVTASPTLNEPLPAGMK